LSFNRISLAALSLARRRRQMQVVDAPTAQIARRGARGRGIQTGSGLHVALPPKQKGAQRDRHAYRLG